MISPFINIVLKHLDKKQYRLLLKLTILAFSVYPMLVDIIEELAQREFQGLSTIGMYGSQYGYTIVNFVLMYIIGGYLRLHGSQIRTKTVSIALICNTVILALWGYADTFLHYDMVHVERNGWEYCNPLVILQAVLVFELFRRMKFQNKIINGLAKASFCVYLIHGYFIGHLGIEKIVTIQNPLITLLHVIVCCIGIYLIGFVVNLMYSWLQRIVDKPILKNWKKHRVYSIEWKE